MKMNKKTLLLGSLTAAIIVLSPRITYTVFAESSEQSNEKHLLEIGSKITMEQASNIVKKSNEGCKVNKIKFKTNHGTAVYEIGITNGNSKKSKVVVNAEDGRIIKEKVNVHKKIKHESKAEIQLQQQTLEKNWSHMSSAQKEQVYALKDKEFDRTIEKVKAHVAKGYLSQAQVNKIVARIQKQKSEMRSSGNAPKFKHIVNLPIVSKK